MIFDTVEECAKLRPYVVDKNEENFDWLERCWVGWGRRCEAIRSE